MRLLSPSLFRFNFLPRDGEAVEVDAEYHPPRRGSRDPFGAPLEPDEPDEILIRHVRTRSGAPVPFGDIEPELIKEAFLRLARLKALSRQF